MKTFNLDSFMTEYFTEDQNIVVDAQSLQIMIKELKNEVRKHKCESNKLRIQNEGMIHTIKILNQSKDYYLDLRV